MADLAAVSAAAADLLGGDVQSIAPLHGGDLSEVLRLTFNDGRMAVAKTGPLVAREARMLAAIHAAGAPAPRVLGLRGELLFLEYLPEGTATPSGWRALGSGLRKLHQSTGRSYGWPEVYAFGPVDIQNATAVNWPTFWAERRLLAELSTLPADLALRLERLAARLPELLPPDPQPSLLHGDLWTGNALFDVKGAAWLIDPACYYGHTEVDLAMLQLFGQPDPAFHEGYGRPEPGFAERRAAYQLWPALVHLRLFGSGYRPMVDSRLASIGV